MRVLNPPEDGKKIKRLRQRPREPQMATLKVRGKHFVVDALNLLAAEITEDRYPAPSASEPKIPIGNPPGCRTLVLNVTHGCNLACTYCYRRNYGQNEPIPEPMSMDIIKRALMMFPYNPKAPQNPRFNVGFFGGEPLVAFERVKEAVAHVEALCAKRGVKASFSMTTNGTLITDEVADFLCDKEFSLIVSLDGPMEVHNRHRPAVTGNSFSLTMAGLERLKERKGVRHITLRSTFTAEGVDLVERLEYLNGLCDHGYAQHVSVEPVSLTEGGCTTTFGDDLAITVRNVKQFLPEYHKATDWIIARARAGKRVRFHQPLKMLQRLVDRANACGECGAGKAYRTVAPDGTIFACHREGGSKIGTVFEGLDEWPRAKWMDNRFYLHEKCPTCWCRWICGGGCRMDSLDRSGNIHKPTPVGCWLKKVWIREAVWLMSELTKPELALVLGRSCGEACKHGK